MAISDLDYTDDSDVALIRRTRTGDTDAYALLHQRHVSSARALAWRMSRSAADADDLVSEGFARVLAALQRGNGPDTAFRPYLLSTIRRLAYDRTDRERREAPVEHEVEEVRLTDDPVLAGFERQTAAAAFASLPERWRMVLWHTEVEGESPAEVAAMLGMKPNAVAALAYRAREGLRQAYLSHHAGPDHELSQECRHTSDRLAAYVRGGLAASQQQRVAGHLDRCDRCQAAYLELASVNTSMRGVLAPIVLGSAAGAAYLAELAAPTAAPHPSGPATAAAALGGRRVARGVRRAVGSPAR
ncbi:MAG: sigma-70 family RNA polymerase sigma factor, partial [Actinobacteria bacterium]|nr:sigma-70 family RNA polymerase sigma factor [Actinomycetota bacterium]